MTQPTEPDEDGTDRQEVAGFSPQHVLLALHIAVGTKIKVAAKKIGIGERTAYRWAATPGLRCRVSELRGQIVDRTVGRLARSSTKAADRLRKLVDDPDPAVQLQASKALLDQLAKLRAATELEQRISAIEAAQARQAAGK